MASIAREPERVRRRPRVLIVDDHEPFRQVAQRLLAEAGFDVVGEAVDGAQALRLAERLRPDVVLLDVQLPDADGFRIAEALADRPAPPDVLLVSGRAATDYDSLVTRSTARGFLAKSDLTAGSLRAVLTPDAGPL